MRLYANCSIPLGALIEKSIKQTAKARIGRQSHVQQTMEKDADFIEIFKKMQDDKSDFTACYKNLIVDMLVENPEILEKTLESFRSEHKRKSKSDIALRAGINQILNMLMNDKRDEEKIREALL